MANVIRALQDALAEVTDARRIELGALARELVESGRVSSIAEGHILLKSLEAPLIKNWEASLPPRPAGQKLSSAHLELRGIPNFETRLGKLYEVIDSGRGRELNRGDLEVPALDEWMKGNLSRAIQNDNPSGLGDE